MLDTEASQSAKVLVAVQRTKVTKTIN